MPVSPLIPPLRREIPAELLSELACVTIGSANVEGLLIQFLIFIMAAAHADGMHVICQNASISTVLKWVRLVSEQRFEPEMYEKLKALFNRIQEAMDDRNAYVHGLWRVGPEPG